MRSILITAFYAVIMGLFTANLSGFLKLGSLYFYLAVQMEIIEPEVNQLDGFRFI